MRRGVARAALAVLSIVSVLVVASPAHADPADVTLVSPTSSPVTAVDGSTLQIQWILNTLATDVSEYTLNVVDVSDSSRGKVVCELAASEISPGEILTCPLYVTDFADGSQMAPGTYDVQLQHYHTDTADELFETLFTVVVPDSPRPLSSSATPLVFYPLVRDGYRDTTLFSFAFSRSAAVVVQVKNKNGRVLRQVGLGTRQSGGWRWNGRNNSGNKVDPGYYWLRAGATADGLTGRTRWIRVQVKTALITKQATKGRAGNNYSSRATSGSCYVVIDNYFNTAQPDCFGGNYALVRYRFAIPSSAYNFSWSVRGGPAGDDLCCHGTISKLGTRTSSKSYVVTVNVTGYRAYEVERARVSYSYKKRI
jgi:FlgD Ig-like domain